MTTRRGKVNRFPFSFGGIFYGPPGDERRESYFVLVFVDADCAGPFGYENGRPSPVGEERPNKSAQKNTPRQSGRCFFWRRHPDSDRGIKVLQTFALPLGYGALKNGAVDEARTRDLHLGKVALYQLSYYRK